MSKTDSQPKLASPGATILAVWSAFLAHWKALLRISIYQFVTLAFTLPAALYIFSRLDATGAIVAQTPPSRAIHTLLILLAAAGSAAMAGLIHPALIATIYMKIVGKDLPLMKAFARSKEVFWRYLIVFVIMFGAVGFASILPGLIGAALAMTVAMYLMFSEQAVVLEDMKIKDALRRSVELVRGRFWQVLWRFLVVAGVFGIASGLASYLLVWKPLDLLDAHLMPVFLQKRYLLLFTAIGTMVSVVALPILLLVQTVFYAELRKHKTPS